jgi:cholesterol oxidase
VGVYFGDGPGAPAADPYFGGAGPERRGCMECGACMTGCRHNAKNTLPKNYLGLAEMAGAVVHPLTTVTTVQPRDGGGWTVETVRTGPLMRRGRTFTADHVVVAAGTYNTQRLLHRMKDDGVLPHLSDRLGHKSRTNSESIVGAVSTRKDTDYTKGVAITSSFFPDAKTHIEPVRYGKGSNLMGMLGTVMTDAVDGEPRWKVWARTMAADPKTALRSFSVRRWSEKGAIALVMQSVDNSLVVSGARSKLRGWHLTSRQGEGTPNPTWIPAGNDASRRIAEKIGGFPMGQLGDLIDAPMTAHFVGGCSIGADADHGVIDAYHRVYGYEGLHVVDAVDTGDRRQLHAVLEAQLVDLLDLLPLDVAADGEGLVAPLERQHDGLGQAGVGHALGRPMFFIFTSPGSSISPDSITSTSGAWPRPRPTGPAAAPRR